MKTLRGKVKSFVLSPESIKGDGEFDLAGYANKAVKDRFNEIVDAEAFSGTLEDFTKNPVMLYMHDPRQPVGTFPILELRPDGLFVKGKIGNGFEPADTARKQIEQGILRALSIGFRERKGAKDPKTGIYHIQELELLEISLVSIPANQEALFQMDDSGKLADIILLDDMDDERLMDIADARGLIPKDKGVVGYVKYPTQSPDTPWSASAARKVLRAYSTGDDGEVNFSKYSAGFAYVMDDMMGKLGGCKLPHHTISDGHLVTNLRGARAAMAVMAGARGGMDMPDTARHGVYNHLARHIKDDFDEDVPAFEDLTALGDDIDDGLGLGSVIEDKILTLLNVSAEDVDAILEADMSPESTEVLDLGPLADTIALAAQFGQALSDIVMLKAGLGEIQALTEAIKTLSEQSKSVEHRLQDTEKTLYVLLEGQIAELAREEGITLDASTH